MNRLILNKPAFGYSMSFIRCISSVDNVDKASVVRDACSLVVLRGRFSDDPKILMGQRGSSAVFMPGKFVFPGGAVDKADATVQTVGKMPSPCYERLSVGSSLTPETLATTVIRELWEEAGQIIGSKFDDASKIIPSKSWESFHAKGYQPNISNLQYIFRAVTPKGRTRRFDARFFLIDAEKLSMDNNLDDFSHSDDELDHLQWVSLRNSREYDLPFITKVILAEITRRIHNPEPPEFLPFFRDGEDVSKFSTVLEDGARDLSEFKL